MDRAPHVESRTRACVYVCIGCGRERERERERENDDESFWKNVHDVKGLVARAGQRGAIGRVYRIVT